MTDRNGQSPSFSSAAEDLRGSIARSLRAHFAFAALLAILFLTFLDNTVASAVLTSVQAELHSNVSQLQWVVGGYALAFASLMLMFGALGDNFGRKKVMLIGVAIFCGGSIVCAIAANPSELVIGRIIMGVGAAASEPGTLSMIRHIFPDRKTRARALGTWAAVSGLALAMGPVIGGILVGIWSWRAVFWFNLLFGALALIVAAIALPERVNPVRRRVDLAGFFFAAVVLGTATFATIQGELTGYATGWVITLYIVSFLTVPIFYYAERRVHLDVALRAARTDYAKRGDEIYADDTLAWVLAARGEWREARVFAVRATRLGTQDPELQYHSAVIALQTGHAAEARQRFALALVENPQLHPVYAADARAELATIPSR